MVKLICGGMFFGKWLLLVNRGPMIGLSLRYSAGVRHPHQLIRAKYLSFPSPVGHEGPEMLLTTQVSGLGVSRVVMGLDASRCLAKVTEAPGTAARREIIRCVLCVCVCVL